MPHEENDRDDDENDDADNNPHDPHKGAELLNWRKRRQLPPPFQKSVVVDILKRLQRFLHRVNHLRVVRDLEKRLRKKGQHMVNRSKPLDLEGAPPSLLSALSERGATPLAIIFFERKLLCLPKSLIATLLSLSSLNRPVTLICQGSYSK